MSRSSLDGLLACVVCGANLDVWPNNHKCSKEWENKEGFRAGRERALEDGNMYTPPVAQRLEEGLRILEKNGTFG